MNWSKLAESFFRTIGFIFACTFLVALFWGLASGLAYLTSLSRGIFIAVMLGLCFVGHWVLTYHDL